MPIHETSIIESNVALGDNTHVGPLTYIRSGAAIGSDCNIASHVFIDAEVTVGDRVTLQSGVQLWNGLALEDDVWVGPNATFTNDPLPSGPGDPAQPIRTLIRQGASIGANATVLSGVTIGKNARIGAGALITKSVPPYAIVEGNPGRIKGYVSSQISADNTLSAPPQSNDAISVQGVKLVSLGSAIDMRGTLSFAEYQLHVPFVVKRCFWVYDVPSAEVRGEHAHKRLHQFLICVKGRCSVVVDDGQVRQEIKLNEPSQGLYIPARTWATQYDYSSDAVLVVLASDAYDNGDYIRDYDAFLKFLNDSPCELDQTYPSS